MSENPTTAAPESTGLSAIVRAFRHRNFRLYFGGQCISLVGTWIQSVALGWTVYQMTHSAFLLGLVGFAGQLPLFLLAPLAGVFVDRYSRHRLLVVTQTLAMIQALVLAGMAYSNHLSVWAIIVLNAFVGTIMSVDMPSRQA